MKSYEFRLRKRSHPQYSEIAIIDYSGACCGENRGDHLESAPIHALDADIVLEYMRFLNLVNPKKLKTLLQNVVNEFEPPADDTLAKLTASRDRFLRDADSGHPLAEICRRNAKIVEGLIAQYKTRMAMPKEELRALLIKEYPYIWNEDGSLKEY